MCASRRIGPTSSAFSCALPEQEGGMLPVQQYTVSELLLQWQFSVIRIYGFCLQDVGLLRYPGGSSAHV
jgi:hypothetical protein